MQKTVPYVVGVAVIALGLSVGAAGAAEINVGVNIAIPAPPIVLAPPALVVVPGTPVHQAPSASFNLFVYRSRYYSFHNGSWFVAAAPKAPWTLIAVEAVPAPVRAVPVKHYKVPPGHAKKMDAHGGGWCPPGQAKKGRC